MAVVAAPPSPPGLALGPGCRMLLGLEDGARLCLLQAPSARGSGRVPM